MNTRTILTAACLALGSLAVAGAAQAQTHATISIQAGTPRPLFQAPVLVQYQAPPPPRYEAIPRPRRGVVWVPGHWERRGHQHVWQQGHWVKARPGYHYRRARWVEQSGRWQLQRGGWDRDGDGVANRYDRDRDGDGVPNRYDRRPDNPHRR